jgi:hypothetical protein
VSSLFKRSIGIIHQPPPNNNYILLISDRKLEWAAKRGLSMFRKATIENLFKDFFKSSLQAIIAVSNTKWF